MAAYQRGLWSSSSIHSIHQIETSFMSPTLGSSLNSWEISFARMAPKWKLEISQWVQVIKNLSQHVVESPEDISMWWRRERGTGIMGKPTWSQIFKVPHHPPYTSWIIKVGGGRWLQSCWWLTWPGPRVSSRLVPLETCWRRQWRLILPSAMMSASWPKRLLRILAYHSRAQN